MFLFNSLLSLFISIILVFYNWKENKNTIYLGGFLFLISIYSLTHYFSVFGQSAFWLAIFYGNFSPFMLLAGPLLYFYVRGIIRDTYILKPSDFLHFVPAVIVFIGNIPYYLTPFDTKLLLAKRILDDMNQLKFVGVNFIFPISVNYIMRVTSLLVYTLISYYRIWKYRPLLKKSIPTQQYLLTYRWLNMFFITLIILLIAFAMITADFIEKTPKETYSALNLVHNLGGIMFLLLSVSLLVFPQILYGFPVYQEVSALGKSKITSSVPVAEPLDDFDEDDNPFLELRDQINAYLAEEKPYLNPDFSIGDLAAALKAPQHHISYCLRVLFKQSFPKLKTSLRIQYAQQLMNSAEFEHLSIEGIGQMAGFSSRSSFYSAFQSEMGCSPGEYLERKLEDE
ncbi:helix-turn-helix domain-containing protein [Aquirufa regiilacus]